MKKMNQVIAMALCACSVFAFAACNKKNVEEKKTDVQEASQDVSKEGEEKAAELESASNEAEAEQESKEKEVENAKESVDKEAEATTTAAE
ncbi:MAG: hypothetical protein Q4P72_01700 [Eubacteriales bacterium]|nr:hypothetical protein [Eubacteriales bacterium]